MLEAIQLNRSPRRLGFVISELIGLVSATYDFQQTATNTFTDKVYLQNARTLWVAPIAPISAIGAWKDSQEGLSTTTGFSSRLSMAQDQRLTRFLVDSPGLRNWLNTKLLAAVDKYFGTATQVDVALQWDSEDLRDRELRIKILKEPTQKNLEVLACFEHKWLYAQPTEYQTTCIIDLNFEGASENV